MLRSLIALSAVAVVVLGEGYSAPPVSPPAGPSYGGSSGPSYGGSGGPSYGGSSGPSYGGPTYGGPTYGGPTYGGPGYPSSGYGGPVYYPPRDLYPDIARARARVYTLANNDDMLSSRLNGVATKINSVTDFRSRFNDEIYPTIQQGMRDQDERIAYFRNQLQELSTLPDMVEELAARVESLLADLQDIRSARTTNLADLDRLKSAGIDQERLISNLETQIEYQERTLDEAEAKVEFSEYQANEVYDNLLVATRITDAEQAQEVVLDVTSTDPIRFEWPSAFTTTPDVFYAIQALAAEDLPDGYSQGYDLDALYASISVVADENGGTLTIDEQSVSWRFTKVQVQVYGYVISNEVIEYQSDAHNK